MKFEPNPIQYVAVYGHGRRLMQDITTKKEALAAVEQDDDILRVIEVKETAVYTKKGFEAE